MDMNEGTARKGIAAVGTEATARKLAEALRDAGLHGRAYPLVKLVERPGWDEGLSFDEFDWVVFSSPAGARFAASRFTGNTKVRIACIGDSTAEAAGEAGLKPDLIPPEHDRESMVEEFAKLNDKSARVFLPLSSASPATLRDGLKKLGFRVTAVPVYDNLPDDPVMRAFARDIESGELAAAAFTSSSAVDYGNFALGLPNIRIYCIGRSTAEHAENKGLKVFGIAYENSVRGLVEIIRANENG